MFLQSDLVRLFCLYSDVVSFALFPLSIWTLGLELLEHFLDESSVGSAKHGRGNELGLWHQFNLLKIILGTLIQNLIWMFIFLLQILFY